MSSYSDINTVVCTVSNIPGCEGYESIHLEKINADTLNAVHDNGFENRVHNAYVFNDRLATIVGLEDSPGFDDLARLEKVVESVHKNIPGCDSIVGHMWFIKENKSAGYDEYVRQHPSLTHSRPVYMTYVDPPIVGSIVRFDGSKVCRTALFNYPLETEYDGVDLYGHLRDVIDEDWPGARNVVFSVEII